ncbi:MAG: hypothetical protein LBC70_03865 [Chitinispirillales bacterium]|jgi:hypothetical protein|nr:hypothetical protein [Chitinispirillales bacterium]
MANIKNIVSLLAFLLCALPSNASLLEEGHYQVTSLIITQDNADRPRGFNNTGLYITVTGNRVRVAGAWRGFPIRRDAIIERTIRDTLVLRDAENSSNVFKFHIRNNVVTNRHFVTHENGTQQVIDSRATLRKLSREEVDRLRTILNF